MTKKDLLFLSGWTVKSTIFSSILKYYQNDFNCHLIEVSEKGSYKDTLSKIVKYLDENHIPEYSVIGWSMGGQLALKLAKIKKPEKLVLLSSAAIFNRDQTENSNFYNSCKNNFTKALKYFNKLNGAKTIAINIQLTKNCDNDQLIALKYLKELHNQDLTKEAQQIDVPTLVIHSKDDQIIKFSEAEYLNSLIKSSKLQTYRDLGHIIFLNDQEINKEIVTFLGNI